MPCFRRFATAWLAAQIVCVDLVPNMPLGKILRAEKR